MELSQLLKKQYELQNLLFNLPIDAEELRGAASKLRDQVSATIADDELASRKTNGSVLTLREQAKTLEQDAEDLMVRRDGVDALDRINIQIKAFEQKTADDFKTAKNEKLPAYKEKVEACLVAALADYCACIACEMSVPRGQVDGIHVVSRFAGLNGHRLDASRAAADKRLRNGLGVKS